MLLGLSKTSNPSVSVKSAKDIQVSQSPTPISTLAINKSENVLIAKVIDGDTAVTSKGEKIRYLGINSSEKGEPFYEEALEKNKSLVLGKNVRLEFDIQNKDRYGRTLAYLFVGDSLINVELVKSGFAVSETIQPNVKYQDKILAAERQTRKSCAGIWSGLCQSSSNPQASNCIKIVTINYNAPGNDNQNKNGEWVKIGNSCSNPISMEGWLLKDSSASNKYKFKNFSLNPSSNVVIHSGCGTDSQAELFWQCPEGKYAVWNNAGDHAFLYNDRNELISDYEY